MKSLMRTLNGRSNTPSSNEGRKNDNGGQQGFQLSQSAGMDLNGPTLRIDMKTNAMARVRRWGDQYLGEFCKKN